MANTVIATATGNSTSIDLPNEPHVLRFTSGGAFVLDLQEGDGSSFGNAYYDATTKVTIDSSAGPQSVRVPGGLSYRMNVTTYNSAITMKAIPVSQ